MKTLAILQNVWVREPARLEAIFAKPEFAPGSDKRCEFLRRLMFAGCKTGRVLEKYFPDCQEWIYEEATPIVGGKPSDAPGWSIRHVEQVLRAQSYDVIITFGAAAKAVVGVLVPPSLVINCPHPCARRSIGDEMKAAAERLQELKLAFAEKQRR